MTPHDAFIFRLHSYEHLPDVEVVVPPGSQFSLGITEQQLLEYRPFNNWFERLNAQFEKYSHDGDGPYKLEKITITTIDKHKSGGIGFLKGLAPITNTHGGKVGKPHFFLRGASVAMLVIIQPRDDPSNKHVVLTVQPRVPAAALRLVELPAGKVEDAVSTLHAAQKELKEELNLDVAIHDLQDLTALALGNSLEGTTNLDRRGIYTSPGGQDETLSIVLYTKHVDHFRAEDWDRAKTGLREEGELIELKTVRLAQLYRVPDAKALCAWALYEGLIKEGKLQVVEP